MMLLLRLQQCSKVQIPRKYFETRPSVYNIYYSHSAQCCHLATLYHQNIFSTVWHIVAIILVILRFHHKCNGSACCCQLAMISKIRLLAIAYCDQTVGHKNGPMCLILNCLNYSFKLHYNER